MTPAGEHTDETLSTLKFATRAKFIQNNAVVNEVLDDAAQLKRYKKQISQLEAQVTKLQTERQTDVVASIETDKQQLAEELAKQEQAFQEQQTQLKRLKGLMITSGNSPRKAAPKSSKSSRRKTWCPGKTNEPYSVAGLGGTDAVSALTLMQTPLSRPAKVSRRRSTTMVINAKEKDALAGLAVTTRDKRMRRSMLLPPPLDSLTEGNDKENVDVLQAKIMVLEKRTADQAKEISTLQAQAEDATSKDAEMPVDEGADAKGSEAQQMIATLNVEMEEQKKKLSGLEVTLADERKKAQENEDFMKAELEVWTASAEDIENDFKAKMERLISPTKVSKEREGLEGQIAAVQSESVDKEKQHQELVTFLEETIQKLQTRGQASELMDTNKSLSERVVSMEKAHKTEVAELTASAAADKTKLTEEVAELNEMLDQMTKKNIDLDEQMKTTKAAFDTADSKATELQEKLAATETSLQTAQETNTQLAGSLASITDKLTATEVSANDTTALQEQIQTLTSQLNESEDKVISSEETHEEEVELLKTDRALLQTEVDGIKSAFEETKVLLEQAQELHEQTKQEVTAAKVAYSEAEMVWNSSRAELEASNTLNTEQIEQLGEDLAKAREESTQATAQLAQASTKVKEIEASWADAAARYAEAERLLEESTAKNAQVALSADEESQATIQDLQLQLDEANLQLEETRSQMESVYETYTSLCTEAEGLKEQVTQAEKSASESEDVQAANSKLAEELEASTAKLASFVSEIKAMKEESEAAGASQQAALEQAQHEVTAASAKMGQLEYSLRNAQDVMEQINTAHQGEVSSLKTKIGAVNSEKERLEKVAASAREAVETVEAQMATVKAQSDKATENAATFASELAVQLTTAEGLAQLGLTPAWNECSTCTTAPVPSPLETTMTTEQSSEKIVDTVITEATLTVLQSRIVDLQQQVDDAQDLSTELADLSAKYQAAEAKVVELEGKAAQQPSEDVLAKQAAAEDLCNDLTAKNESAKLKLSEMETACDQLQTENTKAAEEVEHLTASIETFTKQEAGLVCELETARVESEAKQTQYAAVTAELAAVTAAEQVATEQHIKEVENLQRQLEEAFKEVESLRGEDKEADAAETTDRFSSPDATPKRKKMLSKVKSAMTPRRFKKKRKLFKKGASFDNMLDGADGGDQDEGSHSRAVERLVTPQKKSQKGGKVPREVLYKEIDDTREESRERKAAIEALETKLKEAKDEIQYLTEMAAEAASRPETSEVATATEVEEPVYTGLVDGMSMKYIGNYYKDDIQAVQKDLDAAQQTVLDLTGANKSLSLTLDEAAMKYALLEAQATTKSDERAKAATDDVQALQRDLDAAQQTVLDLTGSNESLALTLDEAATKYALLEAQATTKSDELAKAATDVEQLTADKLAAEQLLLEAARSATSDNQDQEAMAGLQGQIEVLNGQKEDLEDTHLEDIEAISSLEAQVAKLNAELQTAVDSKAAHQMELEELGQKLVEAKQSHSTAEQEIEELAANFANEQLKLAEASSHLEAARTEKEEVHQELISAQDNLRLAMEKAMANAMDMQQQLDEANDKLTSSSANSEDLVATQAQLTTSEEQVADLKMQLATATDSSSDLDAQVQQLQSEVLDMQEQVQGAEAQLKYATTQLREQAATVEELQENAKTSDQLVLDHQQAATQAQDELKHSRACLSSCEARLEMLTMQKNSADEQAAKLKHQYEELHKAHNEQQESANSANTAKNQQALEETQYNLQLATKEIENLGRHIEGLDEELSAQRLDSQKLRQAADDQQEKFQDQQLDAMIEAESKHQAALDKVQADHDEAKKQCAALEQQLQQLQQNKDADHATESKLRSKLEKAGKLLSNQQENADATEEYHQQKLAEYELCMNKMQADLEEAKTELKHAQASNAGDMKAARNLQQMKQEFEKLRQALKAAKQDLADKSLALETVQAEKERFLKAQHQQKQAQSSELAAKSSQARLSLRTTGSGIIESSKISQLKMENGALKRKLGSAPQTKPRSSKRLNSPTERAAAKNTSMVAADGAVEPVHVAPEPVVARRRSPRTNAQANKPSALKNLTNSPKATMGILKDTSRKSSRSSRQATKKPIVSFSQAPPTPSIKLQEAWNTKDHGVAKEINPAVAGTSASALTMADEDPSECTQQ